MVVVFIGKPMELERAVVIMEAVVEGQRLAVLVREREALPISLATPGVSPLLLLLL